MKDDVTYRGYLISHDGRIYRARPLDHLESEIQMTARSFQDLVDAIDDLWKSLSENPTIHGEAAPAWFRRAVRRKAIGPIRVGALSLRQRLKSALKWSIKAGFAFASLCLIAILALFLDMNGDGAIDTLDLASFVERTMLMKPSGEMIRRIRFGDRIYYVTLKPALNNNADLQAEEIRPSIAAATVSMTR